MPDSSPPSPHIPALFHDKVLLCRTNLTICSLAISLIHVTCSVFRRKRLRPISPLATLTFIGLRISETVIGLPSRNIEEVA